MPRIRLGCCLERGTSGAVAAWLGVFGAPEVPAWGGGGVAGWLCASPEAGCVACCAPAGVEGELPCCANAHAVDKTSASPKSKRKKSLRRIDPPELNRNFLLDLENGTIIFPSRPFATPQRDFPSGALPTIRHPQQPSPKWPRIPLRSLLPRTSVLFIRYSYVGCRCPANISGYRGLPKNLPQSRSAVGIEDKE